MKELISVNANLFAIIDANKMVTPQVEIILILGEEEYQCGFPGTITHHQKISNFRFCASPRTLRNLAQAIEKLADDAEDDVLTLRSNPNTTDNE